MYQLSMQSISPSLAVLSIILLIGALLVAQPWLLAPWGHMRIRRLIHRMHKQGAYILENIHLQNRKGNDIHIEYLIIGPEIICLNSAAYAGEIYGSLRDAMWSQSSKGSNYRFENPLRQHARISESLQNIIGRKARARTITVFTRAELHTPEYENITTLKQLDLVLPKWGPQEYRKNKNQEAHLLQNLSCLETGLPIAQHGNPTMLKAAHHLVFGSAAIMAISVFFVLFQMNTAASILALF